MTDIRIDVRGEAFTTIDPERAVVHAGVTADGPEPGPVMEQVTRTLATIRTGLEALQVAGSVAQFAIDQIRITAHRPWNDQGVQLPLVHTASVAITAKFSDFDAAGAWSASDGLTVHSITWVLTEQTRAAVERQTRQQAVRNAARNAQDYADALELGTVRVVSVRDPGTVPEPQMPRMMAAMDAGVPDISLVPEPLRITAEVHAGFTVA